MILRQLGPEGVWPGENTDDMLTVNKYLMCCHAEQEAGLFCLVPSGRTRTNIRKLHESRCELKIRRNFPTVGIVEIEEGNDMRLGNLFLMMF